MGLIGLSACTHADQHAGKGSCCMKMHDEEKGEKNEQKVAVDQLPAAVVATAMKECPDGKITEAEKETKHGKMVYELDVKSGNTAYEVKTAEDGTFISKKVDDDKEDKD